MSPNATDPAAAFLRFGSDELVTFRRQLHAHPELGREEHGTTDLVFNRLEAEHLSPHLLPVGSGLWCDIGPGRLPSGSDGPPAAPDVVLRADLDALPLDDEKDVPYRSTVPGVCHACGHDVHTAVLLGVARFFAQQAAAEQLPGRVRLIFQPAEENPGGALDVMAAGGIAGVDRIFALHCDPRVEVGA